MSWPYRGYKIEIGNEGYFSAKVQEDGEDSYLKGDSIKDLQSKVDLFLKKKGRPSLGLECLGYGSPDRYDEGKNPDIEQVTLLGISGTDSTMRTSPKMFGRFYPEHSHVLRLLNRLKSIETERKEIFSSLEEFEIGSKGRKGWGRIGGKELKESEADLKNEYVSVLAKLAEEPK